MVMQGASLTAHVRALRLQAAGSGRRMHADGRVAGLVRSSTALQQVWWGLRAAFDRMWATLVSAMLAVLVLTHLLLRYAASGWVLSAHAGL